MRCGVWYSGCGIVGDGVVVRDAGCGIVGAETRHAVLGRAGGGGGGCEVKLSCARDGVGVWE